MTRPFLWAAGSFLPVFLAVVGTGGSSYAGNPQPRGKPVILDTDICDDIDDTWAISLLLQSPELDCRLITTAVGNTEAKAKVVAKFLHRVGRTDIPVGIGVKQRDGAHRQTGWAEEYELGSYPGTVYKDGVQALIETIMKAPARVTLIATGPLPNVAEALKREPRIAEKADFVGMHGSVFVGYGGRNQPDAEYNIKQDVEAAKRVFTAPWPMTITPLDTCGLVDLEGENYQKVLKRNSAVTSNLLQNYRVWYQEGLRPRKDLDEANLNRLVNDKLNHSSTTLFDTVAIYLALSRDLVEMKRVPLRITDDGFTRVEEGGKAVDCAVKWKDLGGYERWLADRLTK
jgi:inosine-uridine nucleoside N-ribohydrolase